MRVDVTLGCQGKKKKRKGRMEGGVQKERKKGREGGGKEWWDRREGGRVAKSLKTPALAILSSDFFLRERKINFIMFEARFFWPSCYMESDLTLIDADLPSRGSQSCREDGHGAHG